jgi:amino acid adenylation domain-containing protein
MSRNLASYLLNAAARWPERTAYRDPRGTLTYGDYLGESLRLAGVLARAGVTRGDRVAVSLPKTVALYATIHAALLRGAAYIPIDYTTPVERGRAILADSAARALVTTGRNLARLLAGPAGQAGEEDDLVVAGLSLSEAGAVCIEAVPPRAAPSPGDLRLADLPSPAGAADPAYILYTSGSTGTPKGVVQSHGSATAFVDWAATEIGLDRNDVVPQVASVTFDLSIFDVFAAAKAGACLAPIHEASMLSPVTFCRAVAGAGATVLYCVPSLVLREVRGQDRAWAELAGGRLRHIIFAGEPIDRASLSRLRPRLGKVVLHNWYGPTETNVCAFHRIAEADLGADEPIPIGKACPYARLTIAWDEPAASAPRTGELLVGGATAMAGYWNRPAENAAAFVEIDGMRHYRTGDYVYENAAGRLVFIGRRDRQVKVHGRRVQLDEIEAALRTSLPGIEVACAVVSPDGAAPVIAAAVAGEPAPDAAAIRLAAADRLPLFMMPERVKAVPALPRNERGKIDYARLAALLAEA